MFDYFYEWIQNLTFYIILTTCVLHLLPGKEYKKYVQFFTGLVLILMLITPVVKIFGIEGADFENELEELQERIDSWELPENAIEVEDILIEP